MAINPKKLSLYMIAGIASAVIIIAAVFTSGVQLPSNDGSQNQMHLGTLVVSIKDAPVDIEELWVTLDGLEVQGGDSNGWTKLTFLNGPQTEPFDLLALQDTSSLLSVADLPAGTYTKIRLHVLEAKAIFAGQSEKTELKVPSDKIDIIVKFDIEEDKETGLLIDMTADWAAMSNGHNLRPVIKATVTLPMAPATTETVVPTTSPTESPTEIPTSTPTVAPIDISTATPLAASPA